ncbi:MAG: hypothetical protein NTX53_18680 [candidate division WOR-3 bacterium]|nr:hypothetical protein [candidate division WOR-3 bacterium]
MNTFWKYMLLSRPYSWPDMALTGVLACSVATNGPIVSGNVLLAAGLSLVLWVWLNWTSERFQMDEGRLRPRLWVILLFLAIGVAVTVLVQPYAVAGLAVFVVLCLVYPFKKKIRYVGFVSFAIRGLQTATLFLLCAALFVPLRTLVSDRWIGAVALNLFLLQSSRSLVADIRDVRTDVNELPRRIGVVASTVLALLLFAVSAFLVPMRTYALFGPMLAATGIILLVFYRDPETSAHLVHRSSVISFAAYKLGLSLQSPGHELLVIGLVTVAGIANLSYLMVPRPSNQRVLDSLRDRFLDRELAS